MFPDAAAAVIDALNAQLPALGFVDVAVRSRIPNPRPTRFVLVFRTGGPRGNIVVDGAQLTFEAWAADDASAHDLAQAARAIVNSLQGTMAGAVTLYQIEELSGPGNLPDPVSDQSRYTWSSIVNVRGVAA